MSKSEFGKVWEHLRVNCRPLPEDASRGRMSTFWEETDSIEFAVAMKTAKWYVRQPGCEWFPTLGQFLRAMRDVGEIVDEVMRDTTDPENMSLAQKYRTDPKFREEVEAANRAWASELADRISKLPRM